MVSIVLVF